MIKAIKKSSPLERAGSYFKPVLVQFKSKEHPEFTNPLSTEKSRPVNESKVLTTSQAPNLLNNKAMSSKMILFLSPLFNHNGDDIPPTILKDKVSPFPGQITIEPITLEKCLKALAHQRRLSPPLQSHLSFFYLCTIIFREICFLVWQKVYSFCQHIIFWMFLCFIIKNVTNGNVLFKLIFAFTFSRVLIVCLETTILLPK